MQEIWRDIPKFNDYKVSDLGNIFSKKRNTMMKPSVNKKGYLVVCLRKNKKAYVRRVNRLVALTFIPNELNCPEVNHKDGNKLNNKVNNLEWCDHLHNMQHAFKNKLIPPRKANKGSFPSKKVRQYTLNEELIQEFRTLEEASAKTNYKKQTLSRYCTGKRTCKEYIWRYVDK